MATAFKQIKNNAKSIVNNNALNNTTTTLTFGVENGSRFPMPGNGFYVTAWNIAKYFDPSDDPNMRIGLCTARSGNNLTVTWGQEGTPVTAIKGRPIIALLIVDQLYDDITAALNIVESRTINYTVGTSGQYVTDGTADQTELQAAIDAATAVKGRVTLTSNLVCNNETTLKSYVDIDLNGHTISLANASNSKLFTSTNGLVKTSIRNGYIDGNGANQSSGDYLIDIAGGSGQIDEFLMEDVYVKNSRKHMLFLHGDETGYHRKMIRNCTFDNHGAGGVIGFGVYVDYCPNVVIDGCTFFNSNGNDVVEVAHLGHVKVANCWFQNGDINFPFGDNSIFDSNIFLSGRIINDTNTANNVTITNNIFLGSNPASGYGVIRVHGANSRIIGNSIYNSGQFDGIRVQFGDNHIIANNYVEASDATASRVGVHAGNSANYVIIKDNIMKGFDIAARVQWDNVTIQGNKTIAGNIGVQLANSSGTAHVIANCNVMDNDFASTTTGFDPQNQTSFYGQIKRNVGINPDKRFSIGNIGSTPTINRKNGDYQTATIIGATSPTLTSGVAIGDMLTLVITQDATGSRRITWPSNFKYAGNGLTLSTTPAAVDTVTMRWDGTNWREVSRSIGDAQTRVFNVMDYGAAGDNTADDTVAWQSALTAAGAVGGQVYAPSKVYKTTAQLNVPAGVSIRTDIGATIKPAGAFYALYFNAASKLFIEGLTIDGSANTTAANSTGIRILNSTDIIISRCRILNQAGFGIFIQANGSSATERVLIDRSTLSGQGNNDVIGGGPTNSTGAQVREVIISNCFIDQDCTTNSYQNVFDIVASTRVEFINNVVRGFVEPGFEQYPHSSVLISGNIVRPAIGKLYSKIIVDVTNPSTIAAKNITITDNHVIDGEIDVVGVSGFKVTNVVVTDNIVDSQPINNGIALTHVSNGIVNGNVINNTIAGVYLDNSDNISVNDNVISNSAYGVRDITGVSTISIGVNHYNNISNTNAVGGGFAMANKMSFAADGITAGGNIIPQVLEIPIQIPLNSMMVDQFIYVFARNYQVTNVRYTHSTAATDSNPVTVMVTKENATQAPGTGTPILTSTFDAKATASTNQTGGLSATVGDLQVSSGSRLSVKFSGVLTALAGVCLSISLKRI